MTAFDQKTDDVPHKPVLLAKVLDALAPRDGAVYVDGTFGAGGYTKAILEAADCKVIAIDRDPNAIADGAELVAQYDGRLMLLAGQFSAMDELLAQAGVGSVDGVTLDIGVSSMQLDQAERGFSFMRDGPLDMRMSQSGLSAADVVNTFAVNDLKRIFKIYGEEKKAHVVAGAIGRAREVEPFTTTGQLSRLIENVIWVKPGPGKTIHPATRTFQALRIFVNGELDELVRGLSAAEKVLAVDGRLAVVSFHSLEDRILKRFLKRRAGGEGNPSRHAPIATNIKPPSFKELKRGGLTADENEIKQNPRARSARLRGAIRLDAEMWPLDKKELAQGEIEGI